MFLSVSTEEKVLTRFIATEVMLDANEKPNNLPPAHINYIKINNKKHKNALNK